MSGVFSPRDNVVSGRNADDEIIDINASVDHELNVESRSEQMNEIIDKLDIIIELLKSL